MESYINFLNLEYFFARLAYFASGIYEFFFPPQNDFLCTEYSFYGEWYCLYLRFLERWPVYALILVISGLLLLWMIYSLVKKHEIDKENERKFKEHFIRPEVSAPRNPAWERIQKLFESSNPSDWRIAIIEADILLDQLITRLGYPGETMGERMQHMSAADFPMINAAWEAHKIRNRIAHEGSEYHLDAREAHMVYRLYEAVFRDAHFI